MVREAAMQSTDQGRAPAGEGWFTVNVRDAAWVRSTTFGDACLFEGAGAPFGSIGYTLAVLAPGQPNGMYHREDNQEDFLVLQGECSLIVESEVRTLKAWDFVHCPPGTEHSFVGAGDGPCVIFMAGARKAAGFPREQPDEALVYPRNATALAHGAGVETEVYHGRDAYARYPDWVDGPPAAWDGLPWA